ncbi:MAG: hypothetical protein AAGF53_14715, partial [Pseudomonadota bacterium]
MIRLLKSIVVMMCLVVTPGTAQESDDKAFLERWLQEKLSDAGREITITGFRGALSSSATMDQLTIADENGVWIELNDATLNWSRFALLRGRLEVDELSIGSINIERIPGRDQSLSPRDAEATEFAIPELPISIAIEKIEAELINLGEDVLGQEASLSVSGSAAIDTGFARVDLDILEKNRSDRIQIAAGFTNETKILALDLNFTENAGGIVSNLMGIPGAPDLRLTVRGDAPLEDFAARISLASDGFERLSGSIEIGALVNATRPAYGFSAQLGGDIRPLVAEKFHSFFGARTEVALAGQTRPESGILLERLDVSSEALKLTLALALNANNWPELISLDGALESDEPIPLPVSSEGITQLSSATVSIDYNAEFSNAWRAEFALSDYQNASVEFDEAKVTASGQITGVGARSVTADIEFSVNQFLHQDRALAEAIGIQFSGSTTFNWRHGFPMQVDDLSLQSGDVELNARGTLDGLGTGFSLTGQAEIAAARLNRFSASVMRELSGQARAKISGSGDLLGGAFDIDLSAAASELSIGLPRIDPLLVGQSRLELSAQRSTTGTIVDDFTIQNEQISANATGDLNTQSGQIAIEAVLNDVSLLEPKLTGP